MFIGGDLPYKKIMSHFRFPPSILNIIFFFLIIHCFCSYNLFSGVIFYIN